MDRELEDHIGDLINKSTKDLKTRIVRLVTRYNNKLLKEKTREFKTSANTTPRKNFDSSVRVKTSSRKDSKYHSDSDDYYSD